MNRRDLLKAGVAAGALGLAPHLASAQAVTYAPVPKGWRNYVLTTKVEPTGNSVTATLSGVPAGRYAAAVVQDTNRDGTFTIGATVVAPMLPPCPYLYSGAPARRRHSSCRRRRAGAATAAR